MRGLKKFTSTNIMTNGGITSLKISEQAIRKSLKALENKGYIKIQNMYHSDGGNAANKYIIK